VKVKVSASESYTITIPGDSSVYVGLTREEAVDLLDQLRTALGDHRGTHLRKGDPEPNLPVGTKLLDDEGDVLIRHNNGWRWSTIRGQIQWDGEDTHDWSTVSSEHSFVVIS
jgi:hypothetical protein